MSFTPGSGGGSSTTTQPQRIPVMTTERTYQPAAVVPEDADMPAFTRTDSYFVTGTYDQPDYRYLQASDVRRQVQQAPSAAQAAGRYPRAYHNEPPQPLRAQPPYREFPVVPSPQNGSAPGNYTGGNPGPVRAFYNNNDRTEFDVGYHDSRQAPTGPREGRQHMRTPYSLATYHPAPSYIDTSTYRTS